MITEKPTHSSPDVTARSFYEMLGTHFAHRGKLFQPKADFYDLLGTNEGLQAAYKQLYGWLGVKPRQPHIRFDDIKSQYVITKNGTIKINSVFQLHPYQTGALLAIAIAEHIVTKHYRRTADEQTIIAVTIWAGLGLLVLNGLTSPGRKLITLHHELSGDWHVRSGITLPKQSKREYSSQLVAYMREYSIDLSDALTKATPQAYKLIDPGYYIPSPKGYKLPAQIQAHRKAAQMRWTSLALYTTIAASLVLLVLYVLAQKPDF